MQALFRRLFEDNTRTAYGDIQSRGKLLQSSLQSGKEGGNDWERSRKGNGLLDEGRIPEIFRSHDG